MTHIVPLSDYRHKRRRVYFDRIELGRLLSLYSDRVIRGEWRDYAIDHSIGMALFSVFRHTHDRPLFSIAKCADPNGLTYAVFDSKGRIRRATTLNEALAYVPPRPMLVSD